MPDDPDGNIQHIAEHDVTQEEVEEVLGDPNNEVDVSESSDKPITFGSTHTGRYLAVVWERVADDPETVYPITAYDVPSPRPPRRKRRKR